MYDNNRTNDREESENGELVFPMRINKYLALQRQGSRREMDKLVGEGRVFVNGKIAPLGTKVNEGDKVEVRFHGTKDKARNNEKAMERRNRAKRNKR